MPAGVPGDTQNSSLKRNPDPVEGFSMSIAMSLHPTRPEPPLRHYSASTADTSRAAERRLRSSGGPMDSELHSCRCGAVFPARPTTSVSCPLCGIHQAW